MRRRIVPLTRRLRIVMRMSSRRLVMPTIIVIDFKHGSPITLLVVAYGYNHTSVVSVARRSGRMVVVRLPHDTTTVGER